VRLVQEVLGHATLETLKVYTEITDRRKLAAYRRLGDYLNEVAARACTGRAGPGSIRGAWISRCLQCSRGARCYRARAPVPRRPPCTRPPTRRRSAGTSPGR